jgi:hypothetical protein
MTKNTTAFFGFLLLMLLGLSSNAQQESPPLEQEKKSWFSQTKIGISTSGFQSTLSGVRTDLPPSGGFSGLPHTIDKTYGFSVGGLMQTPIHRFIEIEYGLGYFLEREKISIDYNDWFTGEPKVADLNINLHYLEIPVGIRGILFQKSNNQIILSGNINPRLLLVGYDNYQNIIFEFIGIPSRPWKKIMINGGLSFGFRQKMDNNYLEILAFQSYDFMPMLKKEGWGFYTDLYPARNSQIGIKINYFFKTLK